VRVLHKLQNIIKIHILPTAETLLSIQLCARGFSLCLSLARSLSLPSSSPALPLRLSAKPRPPPIGVQLRPRPQKHAQVSFDILIFCLQLEHTHTFSLSLSISANQTDICFSSMIPHLSPGHVVSPARDGERPCPLSCRYTCACVWVCVCVRVCCSFDLLHNLHGSQENRHLQLQQLLGGLTADIRGSQRMYPCDLDDPVTCQRVCDS